MSAPARRVGPVVAVSAWLLLLGTSFFLNRGDDVGRLPALLRSLSSSLVTGPVFGASGFFASAAGLGLAALIVAGWYGLGDLIIRLSPGGENPAGSPPRPLGVASRCLVGAVVWSLVWLSLGGVHLYRGWVAVASLILGLGLAALAGIRERPTPRDTDPSPAITRAAWAAIAAVQALALLAALAPPTARDALFYHFALPKAYIAAGAGDAVPYNMASFYPQGVEMQVVWAMLLGHTVGMRVAEAAAGATVFAFAPLLVLVIYGWARERDVEPAWAAIAALMIAAIPTVYDIAGSGYVDLALAAYTALAVRATGRWWTTPGRGWIVPIALAVGGALSIKFTAGFVFLVLAVIVLLRSARAARESSGGEPAGVVARRVARTGAGALALGALVAAPWYVRTWVRTGSPVFPFYLDVWPGQAPGWDRERARLYQSLLSMYGDAHTVLDYLLAPVRLALTAQPDQPPHYDGVLGIAFLFALPLLVWALVTRRLDAELRIAALVSTAMLIFWLFSSQQLRFLLPALPGFAVATVAAGRIAARSSPGWTRLLPWLFVAAAGAGLPVILAWSARLDPVRVVLGGESRGGYLERRLDYYPYYELVNRTLPSTARVWLIDMRRDTYHLDRPYFSDFVFEDYTLTRYVRSAQSADEILAQVREAGITHVLVRHDVLFDYARSPIVDDQQPREQNLARLRILADFFGGGTRLIRGDQKFWLIELPRTSG